MDATEESDKLGRLINLRKKNANLIQRTFIVNNSPKVFIAASDIAIGNELFLIMARGVPLW